MAGHVADAVIRSRMTEHAHRPYTTRWRSRHTFQSDATSLRMWNTLFRREAWEYRDWWCGVMGLCQIVALVTLVLIFCQQQDMDAEVVSLTGALFLRWCYMFILMWCMALSLAHSAHGFYDERQDRTVGFWRSWPVSDIQRVVAKLAAIAIGWPLLACLGAWVLTGAAMLLACLWSAWRGEWISVAPAWAGLWDATRVCFEVTAISWPLTAFWLWCSARAPKSPWLWGWVAASAVMAVGAMLSVDTREIGAAIAAGPVYFAAGLSANLFQWLPWHTMSMGWFVADGLACVAIWDTSRSFADMDCC